MEIGDAAHYGKVVETGKGKCGGGDNQLLIDRTKEIFNEREVQVEW